MLTFIFLAALVTNFQSTYEYASPQVLRTLVEGLESVEADFQLQDCYSLGCILVEMLTGKPLFDVSAELAAEVYKAVEEEFVRVCLLIHKKKAMVRLYAANAFESFALCVMTCGADFCCAKH